MKYFIPALLLMAKICVSAPADSLTFQNDNIILGEIKSMDRGVVVVKTAYSDSDFKIEWDKIRTVHSETVFLVTLTDGRKYFGRLATTPDYRINILTTDNEVVECGINDIVYLSMIEEGFLDRLYASIDLGFSLTRANNLRQVSTRSTIGYKARKWSTDATFNTLQSNRDDAEATRRSDGNINYRYVLPKRWYSIVTIALLSNTEQKLDGRMNAQVGLGRFLVRTNQSYWGAKFGLNRNVERYSNETEDRDSWEGYLGTELNLYDIGDFNLLSILMFYPGITVRERWRTDFNLDIKYDLPLDFYIKVGGSLNYDNRPAEGAGKTDYVLQTGFGWEW